MKGANTINPNQATMIEAVQMFLDDQMSVQVVVRSVKPYSSPDGPGFEVVIEPLAEEDAA